MKKIIEILNKIIPNVDFENEKDLIDNKILSSFNIIKLVYELNEAYEIQISPMQLVPENFNSVEAIYNLVKRLEEE